MIDLRSDTVTRPTPGMREAMARAEVGDDVYREDPTVLALEARVAALLGHEAAVFAPSGTMANQLAIGAQAGPGDEVITEASAHVLAYEGGAIAALWGAQPRQIPGVRGLFGPAQLLDAIQPVEDDHLPISRLLCVENTHNRGGGTIWPLDGYREVVDLAKERGLRVHLDGARLWNAAAASGHPAASYGAIADTVSVCLSKGLGAPVGSLVAASKELVGKMRRLRKRLGGGMRQAGILAAAGLWALDHHLERLPQDHENARTLARALASVPGLCVDPPETNLLFVDLPEGLDSDCFLDRLQQRDVLVGKVGPSRVRLVTHLDVDEEACHTAARAFAACL